jgi:hypothetical protein
MKKINLSIQQSAAALAVCSVLLAGCGVKVVPNNVPIIKNIETASLNGVSLIVVNGEKDSSDSKILNEKGQNLGFAANKQAWSKKLVESLASELARRGTQVRANAPLTLTVALPDIIFNQTRDVYQFKVKAAVSLSTGWSKNYDGIAESGLGFFESVDAMANRLAGQALSEAVRSMLGDDEFIAQLSSKK